MLGHPLAVVALGVTEDAAGSREALPRLTMAFRADPGWMERVFGLIAATAALDLKDHRPIDIRGPRRSRAAPYRQSAAG